MLQERWSSLAAARERAADERARLADLEAALAMDPREAQRAMLLRVKADSAECAAVEKDTRAAKDAVRVALALVAALSLTPFFSPFRRRV